MVLAQGSNDRFTSYLCCGYAQGADAVVASLEDVTFADLEQGKLVGRDDRVPAAVQAA